MLNIERKPFLMIDLETNTPTGRVFSGTLDPDLYGGKGSYMSFVNLDRHYHDNLPVLFFGGHLSSFASSFPFWAPLCLPLEDKDLVEFLYWPTREHFFQAHKPTTYQAMEFIRESPTAAESKVAGQSRAWKLRSGWDEGLSYTVMLGGIMHQLDQHDSLVDLLASTEDRFIAEDSPYDYIWGIRDKQGGWSGKNWLGGAWMEARHEINSLG